MERLCQNLRREKMRRYEHMKRCQVCGDDKIRGDRRYQTSSFLNVSLFTSFYTSFFSQKNTIRKTRKIGTWLPSQPMRMVSFPWPWYVKFRSLPAFGWFYELLIYDDHFGTMVYEYVAPDMDRFGTFVVAQGLWALVDTSCPKARRHEVDTTKGPFKSFQMVTNKLR